MLEIYKRMNKKIKEICEARKYRQISKRVYKVHNNIFFGGGKDNCISVDTEEEYLMLFKILQKRYGVLTDEYILNEIKHEGEHVNAAKEICKRHNKSMTYKYGVEFVVTDKEQQLFYLSPYFQVFSSYRFTLEDKIYISSAPENLSDGDKARIVEYKRLLELQNQSNKSLL